MNYISKLFIILFLVGSVAQSQIYNPVSWDTSVEKVSDSEFDLIITATVETGWHLYSQNVPEGGPIPTTIKIQENKALFELIGKPTEGKGHEEFDKVFQMRIKYFDTKAVFKQRVNLLEIKKIDINGVLEFMVCDDTNCLPPTEIDLAFSIDPESLIVVSETEVKDNSFLQQSNITDSSD